jgi:hypothetical protein
MIGIGLNIGNRVMGGGGAAFVGLLDSYPNASCAYSMRRLRSGYTGNAIRVRRVSDNAEQNIGFDGSGNLDTTALTSFCSGTNGFVTTWYDQSGNGYNATQSTASSQPQIVNAGVVITKNGKPTIQISLSQCLIASVSPPITYNTSTKQSIYGVITPYNFVDGLYGRVFTQSPTNYSIPEGNDYALPYLIPFYQDASTDKFGQFTNSPRNLQTLTLNQQYIYTSYNLGSFNFGLGLNGNALTTSTAAYQPDYTAQGGLGNYGIGRALTTPITEKLYAFIQETINYLSDNSASRNEIRSNINTYYNVY